VVCRLRAHVLLSCVTTSAVFEFTSIWLAWALRVERWTGCVRNVAADDDSGALQWIELCSSVIYSMFSVAFWSRLFLNSGSLRAISQKSKRIVKDVHFQVKAQREFSVLWF
jgi:hypothetical protein